MNQEELREYLSYDKDTGIFKWKIYRRAKAKKNSIAGYLKTNGYIAIKINNKAYYAHRLAWLYVYGELPNREIDHINRIKDDNRIENLRDVKHCINMRNVDLSIYCNVGVNQKKGSKKWRCAITVNGRYIHLGYFKNKEDAIKVRKDAELKYGFI